MAVLAIDRAFKGYDDVLKRVLNTSERITHGRLSDVCIRHAALVYAKVRMADVLETEGEGLPRELVEFALQAHYDFVGNDVPLFAVEFDGPHHGAGRQAVRDAKKDHLSHYFGLPLMRFCNDDLRRDRERPDRLSQCIEQWFEEHVGGGNVNPKPLCPECGGPMIEKPSKYGRFLSCARYPACKGSRELPGQNRLRRARVWITAVVAVVLGFGALAAVAKFQDKLFPGAENARPENIIGESATPFSAMTLAERRAFAQGLPESEYPFCPACGKRMVIRHNSRTGEPFFGCSDFPNCRSTRDMVFPN